MLYAGSSLVQEPPPGTMTLAAVGEAPVDEEPVDAVDAVPADEAAVDAEPADVPPDYWNCPILCRL